VKNENNSKFDIGTVQICPRAGTFRKGCPCVVLINARLAATASHHILPVVLSLLFGESCQFVCTKYWFACGYPLVNPKKTPPPSATTAVAVSGAPSISRLDRVNVLWLRAPSAVGVVIMSD